MNIIDGAKNVIERIRFGYIDPVTIKYVIPSHKLYKDESMKFVLIPDLHDYTKSKTAAERMAAAIKARSADYVFVPGDIMEGCKYDDPEGESYKNLIYFLSLLTDNNQTNVFVSLGNHDLVGIKNDVDRDKRYENVKNITKAANDDAKERAGNGNDHVYALINDVVTINNQDEEQVGVKGIRAIGYTPGCDTFDLDAQLNGESNEMFVKDIDENGPPVEEDNDHYSVFVGHNPHTIAKAKRGKGLGNKLKFIDAFLTGHLHNGYRFIRKTLRKFKKERIFDKGWVERPVTRDENGRIKWINPLIYSRTNLCRGTVFINNNSHQKILQLYKNSGHIEGPEEYIYFKNAAPENAKPVWAPMTELKAAEEIEDENLHAVVIGGGVNKYFWLSRLLKKNPPEITEVTIKGTRTRSR